MTTNPNDKHNIKAAFDSFRDALNKTLEGKFDQFETKINEFQAEINEKRLTQLSADLAELDKRKQDTAPEGASEPDKTQQ